MKLPEFLSENEIGEILKCTAKEHHKLAFALGYYQGMRVSEIVKLEPGNIDFNQRLIRIKQSKNSKDRNIPIFPEIYKHLKAKQKLIPLKCGARALQIKFREVCEKATGKSLKFHTLRHSCATRLLTVKKWDSREVQQFLGHSRLDTTQIYTHVTPQHLINKAWEI